MVNLWLDHGQPNDCQPYTFNGTNLTMVDHEQNYQRRDFVNRVWSWRQWPCIIEKAATANTSITWLTIFKVKKTPWYNMINHVQGKTQTWNNITSDSHVWLWIKWTCLTMEYHCRSGRKAPDQDEFNIRWHWHDRLCLEWKRGFHAIELTVFV